MKSQELRQPYLKLKDTRTTSLSFQEQKPTIADCPADIFDAFMLQVFDDITEIDRQKWEIFDKWDVINHCLAEGDLILTSTSDGQLLEVAPDNKVEGERLPEVEQEVPA